MIKKSIDASLGNRIRTRRKSIGMTQADLAHAIGVSFQQVQKYEKGISAISQSRLQQICDIMNLPPEFFTSGDSDFIGKPAPAFDVSLDEQAQDDARHQFMASGEGRRLVDAFTSIADQRLRTRILDFIVAVASDRPR